MHTQALFQTEVNLLVSLSNGLLYKWTLSLQQSILKKEKCNIDSFYLDKIQLSICEY